LLPASLQRQAGTPNASAGVQLAFAKAVQHSLLCAAPTVVLSWPRADGDTELGPSALLVDWPVMARQTPGSSHWIDDVMAQPGAGLEAPRLDTQAPPVSPGEHVCGGTGLLKAQAICPAWAYFQYRLGARRLEPAVDGLDALTRGNLVHRLLCKFWGELHTKAALLDRMSDPTAFADFCTRLIDQLLDEYEQTAGAEPLGPRGRALEAARLLRLLQRWSAVEAARSTDFEVLSREQEFLTSIDGIELRLIVDRIDQLDGGGLLIIDYKTGQTPSPKTWFGDRLTEPQLPIYATLLDLGPDEPVMGVALAAVQLRKPVFTGVASASLAPGLTVLAHGEPVRGIDTQRFPDWDSVTRHWRCSLSAMAREVLAGEAGMWVLDESDLRHCEVKPLLRLPEWRAQASRPLATGERA
jgi:exodeoxyribonuclease-5